MDVRHFHFFSLNTRFQPTAPSPIPATDNCFFVTSRRAASPSLPLCSCWKSNTSACWKQRAGNLPTKVCVGPSPHSGLEVARCKLGCAPAVPFHPRTLGAQHLWKQGVFSPPKRWQMKKRKPDFQSSLCFSRHPKKRSLTSKWLRRPCVHHRQLSQELSEATSGCPASGASEPGTNLSYGESSF